MVVVVVATRRWASLPKNLRVVTRPVAARDYWLAGPLRRWLARSVLNAVLIERRHITAANNPMRDLEAAIDAGSSLIIFPEGRRQEDEDAGMHPFKPGLWHLARRRPEVELIPVHLANLNRMAAAATALGFAGGIVMSAVKRDAGVKDFGHLIPGHGGVLDRVDSLIFASPVIFHLTRFYWT